MALSRRSDKATMALATVFAMVVMLAGWTAEASGNDGMMVVEVHHAMLRDGGDSRMLRRRLEAFSGVLEDEEPGHAEGPFSWFTGSWAHCSAECGVAMQTREVACRDVRGLRVVDKYCLDVTQKPIFSRACNLPDCPTYLAHIPNTSNTYSTCTQSCGGGVMHAPAVCMGPDGLLVNTSFCRALHSTHDFVPCAMERCGEYKWSLGPWSECSSHCGGGVSQRSAACVMSSDPDLRAVDPAQCGSLPLPALSRPCNSHPCKAYYWSVGQWGPCSRLCGGGLQKRSVTCVDSETREGVDDALCLDAGSLVSSVGREHARMGSGGNPLLSVGMPSNMTTCNAAECELCSLADPCSGHGVCRNNRCDCLSDHHDKYCQSPPECFGSMDNTGHCCWSNVLTKEGSCCFGPSPVLDRNGDCCPDSLTLDACGVCGGKAVAVDVQGECCETVLDAAGFCCKSGFLDGCWVCDGMGACPTISSLNILLSSTVNASLVTDKTTLEFAAVAASMTREVSAALGLPEHSVDVFSIIPKDVEEPEENVAHRQAQVDVLVKSTPINFVITNDLAGIRRKIQKYVKKHAHLRRDLQVEGLAQVYKKGICGNGICEIGERCHDEPHSSNLVGVSSKSRTNDSEGCCATDCPVVTVACPVPYGSNRLCGGFGVCHPASGTCSCFEGRTGPDCTLCAAAWYNNDHGGCSPLLPSILPNLATEILAASAAASSSSVAEESAAPAGPIGGELPSLSEGWSAWEAGDRSWLTVMFAVGIVLTAGAAAGAGMQFWGVPHRRRGGHGVCGDGSQRDGVTMAVSGACYDGVPADLKSSTSSDDSGADDCEGKPGGSKIVIGMGGGAAGGSGAGKIAAIIMGSAKGGKGARCRLDGGGVYVAIEESL